MPWTGPTPPFCFPRTQVGMTFLFFHFLEFLFYYFFTVTRYITDKAVTMCQTAGFLSSRIAGAGIAPDTCKFTVKSS